MPQDPEDLIADWERRADQQVMLSTELSQKVQATRATAESHGGEAVVTVDHSGGMADLQLGDRAMGLSPAELAEIILATSRRAQAKMAQQMVVIVNGTYGSESETASFIAGAYTTQFPEPPDDEAGGRR